MFNPGASNSLLEGIGVRKYAGNDSNASDLAIHQDAAVYVERRPPMWCSATTSSRSIRYAALKTQGNVPPAQTPVAGGHVVADGSTFDHNGELGLD